MKQFHKSLAFNVSHVRGKFKYCAYKAHICFIAVLDLAAFIYPEFWEQWHLCLVRCIPRAFGWKIVHRDKGVSWESCPTVIQSKHLLTSCDYFLINMKNIRAQNSCPFCVTESARFRGKSFKYVSQILGWVQQRSWLHGLLVQVRLQLHVWITCR